MEAMDADSRAAFEKIEAAIVSKLCGPYRFDVVALRAFLLEEILPFVSEQLSRQCEG